MAWDTVSKVLDVERTLEAGREEPAERRDERGKARHEEDVDLERRVRDGRELVVEL